MNLHISLQEQLTNVSRRRNMSLVLSDEAEEKEVAI